MKRLAITIGDPGGVGPEVAVKALLPISHECLPVVIGDLCVMEEVINAFSFPVKVEIVNDPGDAFPSPDRIWLIDLKSLKTFKKGMPDAQNSIACVNYIKKAVEFAMGQKVDAVVTAPISKEALKMAGMEWPGHTEMLAEITGTKDYAMMLAGGPLRVVLTTIHIPLKEVAGHITRESVLKTIRLAKKACDMMQIENPRIAVAGLNPHAGESGIFGTEEMKEIEPAVGEAKRQGITVEGPFPPDIVFHKAYKGDVDIVVCMYHDQGLIPLKMIAFDKGVNVTVGLPFIRTSPDHGTAYDIAWKGIADPSSMTEAIRMAIRLRL